jgi:CRP-like cAMP-binding protein
MSEAYRQDSFDSADLLTKLPTCMQDQVRRLTYKSLLDDVPLFKDAMGDEGDKALVQLSHLLSRFKTLVVPPGTAVYEEGSIANDFYLVIEGEIELQSSHSDVGWRISRGAAGGMFFGEHELFFGGGGSPQPSLRSDGGIEEQEVLRRTSSSSTEDGGRKRFHRAMVTSHTKAKLKVSERVQLQPVAPCLLRHRARVACCTAQHSTAQHNTAQHHTVGPTVTDRGMRD